VRTGCEGEPELSLALTPDDARLVIEGTLAPSVAFMQGRLKTSGDNGLLLELLAWTTTPAFGEALAKWRREASVLDAGRGQG
jgi:putative sterol carrier protein